MIYNKIIPALAGLMLACACTQNPPDAGDKSIPTEPVGTANANAAAQGWSPDEADEALYNERFQTLVEAFASGAPTTVYDTLGPVRGSAVERAFARSETGLSIATKAEINAYAAANNSQALIVMKDGVILHEAYFQDANEDTLIVGKSLAKPLGVIAVGMAIQAGMIESLDDPVADYVTEWQGTAKDQILVRHLLDMRTGLLPQANAPDAENVLNRAYLHPSHDQVIIHEYPLVGTPGERYDYSNANAELVASLIERATGEQYEDWIADQILIPLGARGGEVWMNKPGGTAHAGCCILLPARTWLLLADLVINDGIAGGQRLLPEGFVTQMITPTPQNSHSAMGVYIGQPYLEYRGFLNPDIEIGKSYHSEPYLDEDLILFDGNSNQVVYMVPSQQLIVLRVGNSPPREPAWDNAFLANTVSLDLRLN